MINKIFGYVFRFVPALISVIVSLVSIFPSSLERLEEDIDSQVKRIAELEAAYASGEIAPVDESAFFDGDLEAELEAGIKFNEMSFMATHNSYQSPAIDATKKLYKNLSQLTFGLISEKSGDFWSETLTQQLNCGLRSFELDVEAFDRDGEISFTCMHSPYIEMSTSCYDFSLALKEISMWSDNNPNHLPVTVIVEAKSIFIPLEDMKALNLEYAKEFDKQLREGLGDKLFTPADMLRDYSSFGEMRAADDWCKVRDMLGKVLILLHDGAITEDYIGIDPSIKTQAMFPIVNERNYDRDCTSFIIVNDPEELLEIEDDVIDKKRIMVRTRTDNFTSVIEERREQALASGANIISTDYPVRTDLKPGDYVVTFGGNATVRKCK